jgi:hypothetical protein
MKHVKRSFLAVSSLAVFALLVSGCSQEDVNQPERATPTQVPSEPPASLIEGGTASENEKYFNYILRQGVRNGMQIDGVSVVNTVAEAGFDKALMQVSYDSSKTGLGADSIFVSVRVNDQCLLGQVVASDKTVATSVQPAVGPDKSICLIGETRPIDW